jgi:rhodanese-related sulfurtransferase
LDEQTVILIDVRNRTEFNNVGKIPGSHILPLHELEEAMRLKPEDFEAKYGFARPKPEAEVCKAKKSSWGQFFKIGFGLNLRTNL